MHETSGINNSLSIYEHQGSSVFVYPLNQSVWGPQAQISHRTMNKSTNRSHNQKQGVIVSNEFSSYSKQYPSKNINHPLYKSNPMQKAVNEQLQLEVSMVQLQNMLYSLEKQNGECNRIEEEVRFYQSSYADYRRKVIDEIQQMKTKQNHSERQPERIKARTSKMLSKVQEYLNQVPSHTQHF